MSSLPERPLRPQEMIRRGEADLRASTMSFLRSLRPQEMQEMIRRGDELEAAIRMYARRLLAQRAALEKDQRIWRTTHEIIAKAGGIRSGWKTP
jgi:hypothetical protein